MVQFPPAPRHPPENRPPDQMPMVPPGDGQTLQAGVQRRPSDLNRILSHILILALEVALAFVAKKRQGRSRTSAVNTSEGKDGENEDSGKPEISR